ncbi:MAG TPA: Asp-tRNA(Asn)/Glu-tRNA(Gln) amidotransferase subunit GatA, partial [Planctomycetota bacterium]|nr:Asp-tRNA(Asn)/Glu-tRNA(Gln) amidotransferase subunit GatA [Planctomycetota bacterium]
MSDALLHERPASVLAREVGEGSTRAADVARHFLARVRAHDAPLHAFLEVDERETLRQAEAIDAMPRERRSKLPLAGVPVALKDIFCARGFETTCGSKILKGYRAPYDATVVARLRAAGAVLFGRTNMDEFAMGSSTENSSYGPTRNPWDRTRVPGGSSGGSAAAVAARFAPLALGTDTGGSIRQPASLCGISGLKPTYGRVSRYGLVAFASSLDQIGPFAWNVDDTALLTQVLMGADPLDATCLEEPVPDLRAAAKRGVKGLRLGVPREWLGEGIEAATRAAVAGAIAGLRERGASVVEVELPNAALAIPTYYLVATAEASSNLARFDGVRFGFRANGGTLGELYGKTREEGFGAEVKRRILLGTFVLSAGYADAYYKKALQVRALLRRDFERAFERCDVVVGPTSPFPAFEVGAKADDPLAMYLCDLYTAAINLVGLPGMSVPCGFAGSLPIGLQLVAPPLREDAIFAAAGAHEAATDWHRRVPPLR